MSDLQIYKERSHSSWNSILDRVVVWSTKDISTATQIKCISTTLCHATGEGMVTVYY